LPIWERADRTAALIGEYASGALLTELMLTPKPGLVDRRNSGAHRDMNISTFLKSARVLSNWFPRFVEIGYSNAQIPACDFLPCIRPVGVLCENKMLEATKGINTHKGAIFSLGLLCSAAGRLLANGVALTRGRICIEVASICEHLVSRELGGNKAAGTAGERLFHLYGITGARGEAASGYRTVRSAALPVYDRLQANGVGDEMALLQVLLHLLASNTDTNLVSRGGLAGLHYVREYARGFLNEGGVLAYDGLKKMATFDDELIARNLSPGGSADLLAVSAFLVNFPTDRSDVNVCEQTAVTPLS
jgi:triphosphoribosyl-dephospho-CoA synthase